MNTCYRFPEAAFRLGGELQLNRLLTVNWNADTQPPPAQTELYEW